MARFSSTYTSSTLPSLPFASPAITLPLSPFLMPSFGLLLCFLSIISEHFRCQRNDLHELFLPQLACNGTKNPRAARLILVGKQYRRVVFEADVRTVPASYFLRRAHNDSLRYRSLLHLAARHCRLHRNHDLVAHGSIALTAAAQNVHTENLFSSAVVGHVKPGFRAYHIPVSLSCNYFAFSTISTRRQRFFLLSGRVSMILTVSPIPAELFSSWAMNLVVRLTNFP